MRTASLPLLALLACTPEPDPAATTGEPGTGITLTTTGITPTGTTGGTGEPDPTDMSQTPGTSITSEPGLPDLPADTTGTSDTGDESTSTGAAPLAVASTLITADNRHYVEMHGGWGPHLRGLMRADDDALWFTVDAGESVLHNREVVYMRRGPAEPAWAEVARNQHTPGVQQNAASILLGGYIYSYAIDVASHWLEECNLQVTDPSKRACNAVYISGKPYIAPTFSNYVGAAVLAPGSRLVWWTVVGVNGGPGAFYYTYNFGGGWNGPVVTGLGAANDLGYVHAMRTTDGHLRLGGQAFTGKYPDGFYSALVADLVPGQALAFTALAGGAPQVTAQSVADLWLDPASGAVHVLATRSDSSVAYYHRPAGATWAAHAEPLHGFPDTYRARFMRPEGGPLHLVRGSYSGAGVELLRAVGPDVAGPIDWTSAEVFPVPPPAEGLGAPSGLYVESPTYQAAPVAGINFAMCGQYQISDGQVWHGRLE
jgi:hypothetical protein